MFITKKRYKKQQTIMYSAVGVSGVIGATGTALGVAAIIKANKVKSDVDNFHTDIERRMAAEEGMTRQFNRAISQIQDVLEKNDMLRVRQ